MISNIMGKTEFYFFIKKEILFKHYRSINESALGFGYGHESKMPPSTKMVSPVI